MNGNEYEWKDDETSLTWIVRSTDGITGDLPAISGVDELGGGPYVVESDHSPEDDDRYYELQGRR